MPADGTQAFTLARLPSGVEIVTGGPSAFSREEWDEYDSGRPDRCSHDLMVREARRMARDRDGQ
jgi:hypothetical protein